MKIGLFDYNDLNIVEFNTGNSIEEGISFSKNSKYLHGSVFSIIQTAFDLSNPNYSYYKTSEFKGQDLIRLRNNLQDQYSRLRNMDTFNAFERYLKKQVEGIVFINDLKTFYPDWKIDWESIRNQLLRVCEELLELTDTCIDEDGSLKIRGY